MTLNVIRPGVESVDHYKDTTIPESRGEHTDTTIIPDEPLYDHTRDNAPQDSQLYTHTDTSI